MKQYRNFDTYADVIISEICTIRTDNNICIGVEMSVLFHYVSDKDLKKVRDIAPSNSILYKYIQLI